jgi:hypothetical protein
VLRYFTKLCTGKKTIPVTTFPEVVSKKLETTYECNGKIDTSRSSSSNNSVSDDQTEEKLPTEFELPKLGESLRRHKSKQEVIFVPFKSTSSKKPEAPSITTFAGQIYLALQKYSGGMQFDFHNPDKRSAATR